LREQSADCAERTGPRHNHPEAPQGQDGRLGFAQLRKVRGDDARPLVHWVMARHGLPLASWSVSQSPSMPDRRSVLPSSRLPCLLSLTQKPPPERGNPPGKFKKLLEPLVSRLSKVLDSRKTLRSAKHGAHGNDQNVAQMMASVPLNPRIRENRKVFKQSCRWSFLHWTPLLRLTWREACHKTPKTANLSSQRRF